MQRKNSGHQRGSGSHSRPKEHIEHPHQADKQGTVHLGLDEGADENAQREIDNRDEYRRRDCPKRAGDASARSQGHETSRRCQQGQAQRGTQTADDDGPGAPAGCGKPPIGGACPADLEKPG